MCKIHIGLLVMPKKTQFLESVNENKEKNGQKFAWLCYTNSSVSMHFVQNNIPIDYWLSPGAFDHALLVSQQN